MKKIGMLTIGQSPRDDILPILMDVLGDGVEVLEAGALDDKTMEDVKRVPLNPEDYILVSRMRDGTEIKITKKYILPLMQRRLEELEAKGVRLTVVMCTGKFPQFRSRGLVVTPSEILRGVIEGSLKKGKLGVVFPAVEQTQYAEKEFGRPGVKVYADSVSPYEPKDVDGLVRRLKEQNLDLIFLNCFGFPTELKDRVAWETGKPVIQSNVLIARVMKELV
ncbi:MAG: AroM family protein [Candidatus Bathyarchaeota archaeon]